MGMWPGAFRRSWNANMQPKQNIWNLVLFVVLSTLILFGWNRLQNWLWPPPPRPWPPIAMKLDPSQWADLLALAAGSAATPTVPGAGHLSQLSADLAVAYWAPQEHLKAAWARKSQPPKQPPKVVPLPAGEHEEITLGGEAFNLQVVVTSRGAGVQKVVLTRFKAADEMGRPMNSPLNLVPDNPLTPSFVLDQANDEQHSHQLRDMEWTVVSRQTDPDREKHEVVLSADIPGQDVRVLKTYTLTRGDYHVGLTVEIQHQSSTTKPIKFSYLMTGPQGLPIEGVWYTNTYRNALIGTVDATDHLWRNFQDARSIGSSGPQKEEKTDKAGYIQYAGIAIQYFASMIVVDNQQEKKDFLKDAQPFIVGEPDTKKPYLDDISVQISTVPIELQPGGRVVHKYLLYNGPVKVQLLGDAGKEGKPLPADLLDRYLNKLYLNTLTDYHSPGFMGEFASRIYWTTVLIFFTNLMHRILEALHTYIPFANYGVCVILLTLLVRGLMHPISRKQARTSIRMQALVPELKKLQEKYKNDRQALAMAQMELHRKHGVSPMGSCWVVLLQMPIFMGLYYALQESIHFRLAPFLWIKNLAAPDMLFYWGEHIPYISEPAWFPIIGTLGPILGPYFNLLPVIAVALMIVQQKFLMPPATDETQEMQQKMMKYMSIVFGIMFFKVAAGLCIYFIVSSLWGLTERKLLPKAKPVTASVPAAGQGGSTGKASAVRSRPQGPKSGQTNGTFKKVQDMWTELLKQAKKK
jgi:YidC/Oxa1 family membrane protein insertase